MQVFTKQEVAEIALRPLRAEKKLKDKVIHNIIKYPVYKFKRAIEQSTDLKLMNLGNDKFYFKYTI